MSAALVGQAGAGLFQFLQGLSSSSKSSATDAAATTASTNASTGTTTIAGHHHKHGGGGFEKLANAVTSALQSASGGGAGADANQTIVQALTKIFQNGSLSATGETDPTSDNSQQTSSTDPASKTTNGLPDSFVQALKAFGVTPQQFQTDLANALQTAQKSGSINASAAFKSFPAGRW